MSLKTSSLSLFSGVRECACQHLGIENLDHRSSQHLHVKAPLSAVAGRDLVPKLFNIVEANLTALLAEQATEPSTSTVSLRKTRENWRLLAPNTKYDDRNKPREVGLERAVVRAFKSVPTANWWNQVPVASGLFGPTAGKRRAIDLVRQRSSTEVDFIELKLGSNTPLFAAVEILEYGFAWLLSKKHASALGYDQASYKSSLLAMKRVHLSVLAPDRFYRKSSYTDFALGVDEALKAMGSTHGGRLTFQGFKAFNADWEWLGQEDGDECLRQMLDVLSPPVT